jgi:hypothetical protein
MTTNVILLNVGVSPKVTWHDDKRDIITCRCIAKENMQKRHNKRVILILNIWVNTRESGTKISHSNNTLLLNLMLSSSGIHDLRRLWISYLGPMVFLFLETFKLFGIPIY